MRPAADQAHYDARAVLTMARENRLLTLAIVDDGDTARAISARPMDMADFRLVPDLETMSFRSLWTGLMRINQLPASLDGIFRPAVHVWEEEGLRIRMLYLPQARLDEYGGQRKTVRQIDFLFSDPVTPG